MFLLRTIGLIFLVACSNEPDVIATTEQLMDPKECQTCHPAQYLEWSGSMHAYAANDPLFLALNKRGQEETNGALGDFCVQCHAPMAHRLGLTTDGLNLDTIDQKYKGVTCYFCHTIEDVTGTHNNPIELAADDRLLGGYDDAIANGFHKTGYSELLDGRKRASADACGSCHDIVLQNGVHLERTFAEWKSSLFNAEVTAGGQTCGFCHMNPIPGPIANFEGAPTNRERHDHRLHGVDVAVTEWPQKAEQLAGIQDDLFVSVNPTLCVNPPPGNYQVDVTLKNVFAGHRIPSGSGFDRRMWVELIAYNAQNQVVFSTGVVPDDKAVVEVAETDQLLWQIRDFARKENGEEAHFFWEVASVEDKLLPEPIDPQTPHSLTRKFSNIGNAERITMRVMLRPVAYELLDDLIASGHLDAALKANYPTHILSEAQLEWNVADGFGCFCRNGKC